MRNPNGYGSVYKLSGNRRKPWAARVTLGFKPENGQPVYKFICYCKTRAEAMRALALYNGDELTETQQLTLKEVYDEWSEEHFPTLKRFDHYESAFRVLKPIYSKKLAAITVRDCEECFLNSGKSKAILVNAKTVLKFVYVYAFRAGYIDESKANMPNYINFSQAPEPKKKKEHRSFTHEEVAKLWENKDNETVQIILFLIYSGLRISELANLKKEDVHLKERYLDIIESKTKCGIRKVPIADKIMFIAERLLSSDGEDFVNLGKSEGKLGSFRTRRFEPITESICGVEHIPHDTRYTTATFLTEAQADIRYIKLILGHAQKDVTNDVYARKIDNKVLLETINLI